MHDLLTVSQLTAVNGSTIKVEIDGNGNVLVNGMSPSKAENTENALIALYILEPLEVVGASDAGESAVGTGG